MKKLYLSIVLIFIFSQINSQVSGYLGKKMITEITVSAYPALFLPTYNTEDISYVNPGLNLSYDLSLDYIVSRKGMIGIKAGFLSTGLGSSEGSSGIWGFGQLRVLKTGFRYTSFNKKKGGAAPLGRSNAFGIDFYSVLNAKVDDVSQVPGNNYFVAFTYAWSNRHVINDRFIIKYGPEFSFFTIIPISALTATGSTNDFTNLNALGINFRLLAREFYKVQFSVGYLIF